MTSIYFLSEVVKHLKDWKKDNIIGHIKHLHGCSGCVLCVNRIKSDKSNDMQMIEKLMIEV